MPSPRSVRRLWLVVAAAGLTAAAFPLAASAGPFRLGLHAPDLYRVSPDPALVQLAADSHASIMRAAVYWNQVAPNTASKPAGFDARNPADPLYDWATTDAFVRRTAALGMDALLTTVIAPAWAEGLNAADRPDGSGNEGTYRPDPQAYGDFTYAIAKRYDGTFPDPANPGATLPRVRYWQAWNEPNFGEYLNNKGRPVAPIYTDLLNAFYASAKSVAASNRVLTAGLGPYGFNGHATDIDPQLFFRQMFCLTRSGNALKKARRCTSARPRFDIMAQHPYTFTGTPTTKAQSPDGGGLGNIGDMQRTLKAAVRYRTVLPAGQKSLWVSEFGWYSNPPGRVVTSPTGNVELGKPLPVQAAYLSETAYRLWKAGVSAMVWYALDDLENWPGGLYFGDGRKKPAARAFAFPFFAQRRGARLELWGTLTDGANARVRIERRSAGKWRRSSDARTDRYGILDATLSGKPAGSYRARVLTGTRKGTISYPSRAG